MENYHLKYQDSELGYTYQRWPDKKSSLKAAIRVGKTRESMVLGMYILPLSPALASAPAPQQKRFPGYGRGKAGIGT